MGEGNRSSASHPGQTPRGPGTHAHTAQDGEPGQPGCLRAGTDSMPVWLPGARLTAHGEPHHSRMEHREDSPALACEVTHTSGHQGCSSLTGQFRASSRSNCEAGRRGPGSSSRRARAAVRPGRDLSLGCSPGFATGRGGWDCAAGQWCQALPARPGGPRGGAFGRLAEGPGSPRFLEPECRPSDRKAELHRPLGSRYQHWLWSQTDWKGGPWAAPQR